MSKKPALKNRLKRILRNLSLYQRCDVADPIRIELLLQERKRGRVIRRPNADRGEAEAVIQATQIGASFVIVDDPAGRAWAKGHRIESHGLVWLLGEFRRNGIITDLRPVVAILKRIRYRLPPDEIQRLLVEFGEDED